MVPECQHEAGREVLDDSYRIIDHVGKFQVSILAVIHNALTLLELSTIQRKQVAQTERRFGSMGHRQVVRRCAVSLIVLRQSGES